MNIKEAIKWLEYKPRFKDKTDLTKMEKALKLLNNPEKSFKAIHITGTNGKGSVAHTISKTLSKVKKVGLFTSPYVLRFNERLQINEQQIEDDKLLEYIIWAKEFDSFFLKEYEDNFSFFELLTLIMIKYFSDEKVDYAVVEVGIGGRLDATNVIDAEYAVITSLGLDHTPQLGETLKEILTEKLGILKDGKMLFTAVDNFNDIILDYAKEKKSKVKFVKDEDFQIFNNFPLTFMYDNEIYMPNLQGLYQVKNTILAILVLKEIIKDINLIKEGVKKTTNPGRFEVIEKDPYIILDGAHNVEAMEKLIISLKKIFPNKQIKVLYTSMLDKPYVKIIEKLKELTNEIYLTTLNFPRAITKFNEEVFNGLEVYADPLNAFKEKKEQLTVNDVLVVTGSMYLVSLIRNELIKNK